MADDAPSSRHLQRLLSAVGAWQPLTGRGLAAFAEASGSRVLAFQTVLAALLALALAWSVRQVVTPPVQEALSNLPLESGGIRDGQMHWPGMGSRLLAQSPQLALAVDPDANGELGLNGDVQLDLGNAAFTVRGLLGQTTLGYPAELDIPLDRTGAAAAWGAWRLPFIILLGCGGFVFVLGSGWIVASVYAVPVWAVGRLLCRRISLPGAWRLSNAALWPAALLPGAGLLLYATLWIHMPGLVALWILHFPAQWAWLAWATFSLPPEVPRDTERQLNPFLHNADSKKRSRARASKGAQNPFAD